MRATLQYVQYMYAIFSESSDQGLDAFIKEEEVGETSDDVPKRDESSASEIGGSAAIINFGASSVPNQDSTEVFNGGPTLNLDSVSMAESDLRASETVDSVIRRVGSLIHESEVGVDLKMETEEEEDGDENGDVGKLTVVVDEPAESSQLVL